MNNETRLLYTVLFLLGLDLLLSIAVPLLRSWSTTSIVVQGVSLHADGTTEQFQATVPPPPPIPWQTHLLRFLTFYLPLTLLGVFLLPDFVLLFLVMERSYFVAHFLPHLLLWCLALASISCTIRWTNGLSAPKRAAYVYLIAALITGMAAQAWSTILRS